MYHDCSQEDLRSYCRTCIESYEMWARRLIHEKMVEEYGINYLDASDERGDKLIKKDVRERIRQKIDAELSSYPRTVDALNAGDITYFLCNSKWYHSLFKAALDFAFPQGQEEAREFLDRITPIRNSLSHARSISIRQAEQVICYTHDFIEGIKQYYKDRGEDRMWNVPQIIRATDSRGREIYPPSDSTSRFNVSIHPEYYVGDRYSIQIEIDSSYPPDSYSIHWLKSWVEDNEHYNQPRFSITFSNEEIGQVYIVTCKIVSKNEWHRYRDCDDEMNLMFTVLPPKT